MHIKWHEQTHYIHCGRENGWKVTISRYIDGSGKWHPQVVMNRKPNSRDDLIHHLSQHDMRMKTNVVISCFHWAFRVCSWEFLQDECDYSMEMFSHSLCPLALIHRLRKRQKPYGENVWIQCEKKIIVHRCHIQELTSWSPGSSQKMAWIQCVLYDQELDSRAKSVRWMLFSLLWWDLTRYKGKDQPAQEQPTAPKNSMVLHCKKQSHVSTRAAQISQSSFARGQAVVEMAVMHSKDDEP